METSFKGLQCFGVVDSSDVGCECGVSDCIWSLRSVCEGFARYSYKIQLYTPKNLSCSHYIHSRILMPPNRFSAQFCTNNRNNEEIHPKSHTGSNSSSGSSSSSKTLRDARDLVVIFAPECTQNYIRRSFRLLASKSFFVDFLLNIFRRGGMGDYCRLGSGSEAEIGARWTEDLLLQCGVS